MSSIVTAITGGGDSGINYRAKNANVLNPATVDQANQQYTNMNNGLDAQQQLLFALQGQNGIQNQANVMNQLQGVANGTGANPAQAMLANTTGANVANQAALMAGQRGAGANVGMMARQAAQQGANTQQQAAGQGAALQAQQSLGALGQMGSLANQQVAQQQGATNAYMQGTQGAYGNVTNAIQGQNNANVGMQSNMNSANAAIAAPIAQGQMNTFGNAAGAIGSAMMMAEGGEVAPVQQPMPMGHDLMQHVMSRQPMEYHLAEGGPIGPRSSYGQLCMAKGGPVPAMVSPGEKYLTPQQAAQAAQGKVNPMSTGKTIPGVPQVPGAQNSYANDTVPMTLQEGGLVIPRSITQGPDASKKAMDFVKAHYAMQSKPKGK